MSEQQNPNEPLVIPLQALRRFATAPEYNKYAGYFPPLGSLPVYRDPVDPNIGYVFPYRGVMSNVERDRILKTVQELYKDVSFGGFISKEGSVGFVEPNSAVNKLSPDATETAQRMAFENGSGITASSMSREFVLRPGESLDADAVGFGPNDVVKCLDDANDVQITVRDLPPRYVVRSMSGGPPVRVCIEAHSLAEAAKQTDIADAIDKAKVRWTNIKARSIEFAPGPIDSTRFLAPGKNWILPKDTAVKFQMELEALKPVPGDSVGYAGLMPFADRPKGADFIVVDDPLTLKEATNLAQMSSASEWYEQLLAGRTIPSRLHHDDVPVKYAGIEELKPDSEVTFGSVIFTPPALPGPPAILPEDDDCQPIIVGDAKPKE